MTKKMDEEQTDVEEEAPQLQTFTVKVDGQEVEVTQEELVNGYSRQQDYTRKTQELSQQRKTIEQQQTELAQRDAIYSQLLPKMEAQLKGELANEPDWNTLYEDDPVGYVREKQLWDEKKEKLRCCQVLNNKGFNKRLWLNSKHNFNSLLNTAIKSFLK